MGISWASTAPLRKKPQNSCFFHNNCAQNVTTLCFELKLKVLTMNGFFLYQLSNCKSAWFHGLQIFTAFPIFYPRNPEFNAIVRWRTISSNNIFILAFLIEYLIYLPYFIGLTFFVFMFFFLFKRMSNRIILKSLFPLLGRGPNRGQCPTEHSVEILPFLLYICRSVHPYISLIIYPPPPG